MRPIELDFRARRRASAPGYAALVVGLLLSLAVVQSLLDTRERSQGVQAELGALKAKQPRPVKLSPRERAAQRKAERAQRETIAGAQVVAGRLAVPWGRLLAAVEDAGSGDVAVTALSPDPAKRLVRIDGQARDLRTMLQYNARLAFSGQLSDIALVSHELMAEDAERPVRFSLTAVWGAKSDAAQ